jgi:hypothetical protein
MKKRKRSGSPVYTRLHARITEEDGSFTLSVRLLNHLKMSEEAWGEEVVPSIEIASSMVDGIAEQFAISQKCVSVSIVMNNFRDGTFH